MNDTALGEFLSLIFLPYVPTLAGAVIGAILSLFIIFMLEILVSTYKEPSRVSNSNPVQGAAEP